VKAPPALLAGVFALAMAAFGLTAHRPELAAARHVALGVAAASLLVGLATVPPTWWRPGRRWLLWMAGSVAVGTALAAWLRVETGQNLVPTRLTPFALVAAGIGLMEEVAYRGFVQDALRRWGALLAIAVASAAHTAYKTSLFVLPDVAVRPDLWTLAIGTFVVGLLAGLARERGAGLLFPVAGHVVFDVIAYGDLTGAPWWV
jgi:membrane protease YdiL (CAAX protease family)